MVFQWFCHLPTIAIKFFTAEPLTTRVLPWFSKFWVRWSSMVEIMEKGQNYRSSDFWNFPTVQVFRLFWHIDYIYAFKQTQTLNWEFSRHLQHISHDLMLWFSGVPSPLNGMVGGNHWKRWFSDGFWVRQLLVTNDGFQWLSTIGPIMECIGTIVQV